MANAKKNTKDKQIEIIVTEQYLNDNPALAESGVKVGGFLLIENPDYIEPKSKVVVNFGVYIPSMGKEFSKEEIEADENIQAYLLEIGSGAVTEG